MNLLLNYLASFDYKSIIIIKLTFHLPQTAT
jgi:hypothetical protein